MIKTWSRRTRRVAMLAAVAAVGVSTALVAHPANALPQPPNRFGLPAGCHRLDSGPSIASGYRKVVVNGHVHWIRLLACATAPEVRVQDVGAFTPPQ